MSAFNSPQALHFMTQLGNSDLVVCDYYNLNNNGFGALYRMPIAPPPGQPFFDNAFSTGSPGIRQTVGGGYEYPLFPPFTPRGIFSITPFTTGQDEAAPVGAGGVPISTHRVRGGWRHPCSRRRGLRRTNAPPRSRCRPASPTADSS